jgi:hypothetical protein
MKVTERSNESDRKNYSSLQLFLKTVQRANFAISTFFVLRLPTVNSVLPNQKNERVL